MVSLRGVCSDDELAEVSFHLLLNLHHIMGHSYDVSAVDQSVKSGLLNNIYFNLLLNVSCLLFASLNQCHP